MEHDPGCKRSESTTYVIPNPIKDPHEALDLLAKHRVTESNERKRTTPTNGEDQIHIAIRADGAYEIVAPWFRDFDGSESLEIFYFQIKATVVEELERKGWIEKYEKKKNGILSPQLNILVITVRGIEEVIKFNNEQLANAVELLGAEYLNDEGKAQRMSWGRERHRYGPFFVDYATPDGKKRTRVYPESGRVVEMVKDPESSKWFMPTVT